MSVGRAMASGGAVAAILCGALASLSLIVLLLASSPNSGPEQLRRIRMWMWIAGAGGAACAAGGIALLSSGSAGSAIAVGGFPAVAVVILIVVAVLC